MSIETAIWAMIVVVALSGLVLTIVLGRMAWTKDYSLLFGHSPKKDQHVRVPVSAPPISRGSLDLAVAHFVKETADAGNEAERLQHEEELRELRTNPDLK